MVPATGISSREKDKIVLRVKEDGAVKGTYSLEFCGWAPLVLSSMDAYEDEVTRALLSKTVQTLTYEAKERNLELRHLVGLDSNAGEGLDLIFGEYGYKPRTPTEYVREYSSGDSA